MHGIADNVEWYLARNGQRYGPLSEIEFRKFIELGHLKPSDLIWREGFSDWRLASSVFPSPQPPQAPRMPVRPVAAPAERPLRQPASSAGEALAMRRAAVGLRPDGQSGQPGASQLRQENPRQTPADVGDDEGGAKPRRLRRTLVAAMLLMVLGAGIWMVLAKRHQLLALAGFGPAPVSKSKATGTGEGGRSAPAQPRVDIRFAGGEAALDSELQKGPLWRILRTEFPEWYQQRVQTAARLKAQLADDKAFLKNQLDAVVELRRKHQADALGSSLPRLRAIASSFLVNLEHLRRVSADACFGYISQGESSPAVVELMQAPEHSGVLDKQITSVFEAVAEGRRSPRAYPAPKQADFDTLARELSARGWKDQDMQLFADPKALAQAKPERVCQMLQDWFSAQLAVKDPDIQLRLLVDALRPVVAG